MPDYQSKLVDSSTCEVSAIFVANDITFWTKLIFTSGRIATPVLLVYLWWKQGGMSQTVDRFDC